MKRLWGVLFLGLTVCCVVVAHFYFSKRQDPVVSVVMSTYKRADRVGRAIESVLNQTFRNFEFIIINDGSPDNTSQVVRAFQKKDSRIIFLENKQNKGLIYSLNRGLRVARGKYIARIDDDDEMLPQRLEKQVAYMDKNPEASVLGTGYYVYKTDDKNKDKDKKESADEPPVRRRVRIGCPSPPDQVYINLHFGNGMAHPTTMLRRSFLEREKLQYNKDYKSAEDYKLWTDVVRAGGQIHCLKDPLTEYTRAGDNPSSFYKHMSESTKRVRTDILADFFDKPQEMVEQPKCEVLKQMAALNLKKKILNQDLLKQEVRYNCPPEDKNAYKVTHSFWTDYFIFTDNGKRIHRFQKPLETATVVSFKGNELVLKWDKWPREDYICDRQAKTCEQKN